MQSILDHIANVVRPSFRAYSAADGAFMEAQKAGAGVDEAKAAAMLAARQATIELHHLSDFAVNNPAPGATFADLRSARSAVQSHLIFLREPRAPYVDDVLLLRDLADTFKHFKLDRPSRTVDGAGAIVMTGTGWGKLRWGEGKWGAPSR